MHKFSNIFKNSAFKLVVNQVLFTFIWEQKFKISRLVLSEMELYLYTYYEQLFVMKDRNIMLQKVKKLSTHLIGKFIKYLVAKVRLQLQLPS